MRPIKLLLEGFTCFRSRTELDFRGADLFAITGPTGSGKTSLIDALIFSLYGCTPRCGERAVSDLITLGAQRLTTYFEFSAGSEIYRISRAVRKTRSGISTQRRLEKREGADWKGLGEKEREIKARIQQILGLDFEGFTRSIVLPQGEFDRFLKGDPGDRRNILAALLKLDKYARMRNLAYRMSTDCLARASTIDTILKEKYSDVSREREKELEKQLKDLRKTEAIDASSLEKWRKAEPVAREIRRLRGEKSRLEQQLLDSEARGTEAERARDSAARELRDVRKQQKLGQDELANTGYDKTLHLRLSAAAPLARRRLELESRVREKKSRADSQEKELEKLDRRLNEANRTAGGFRLERERSEESLKEKRAQLGGLKETHGTAAGIEGLLRRLKSSQDQRNRKTDLLVELAKLKDRQELARKESEVAEADLREKDLELAKVEKELESSRQRHAAGQLRSHLREGDICPVCEQVVREVPHGGKHGTPGETEQSRDRLRSEREEAQRKFLESENLIRELPGQQSLLEDNIRTIEAQLSELDGDLERCLGSSPGKNPGPRLQALIDRLTTLEKQVHDDSEALAGARMREEVARAALDELKQQRTLVRFSLDGLTESVEANLAEKRRLEGELGEWQDLSGLPDLLAEQEKAAKKQHHLKLQMEKLDHDLRICQEHMTLAERELAMVESEATRTREQLREVTSLLNDRQRELHQMKPGLVKTLVEDEASRVEAEIRRLEGELRHGAVEIARTAERLDTMIDRRNEAADLKKERKSLQTEADTAARLKQLLRGDQLVDFILREVLSRLAVHGTDHLRRLSSERYSFAVRESHFFVIDHWNADGRRSVSTLSGGEAFLASLALALALSESLDLFFGDNRPVRLESLFLDEGFSTLDAETLDLVVQGIETLAANDRVIGIISHVPELAERFPYRIEVEKRIEGSRIRVF